MNYEKLYKEALERARKNYKTAQDYLCEGSQIGAECLKNTLTSIFPELNESSDEMVRKALIDYFDDFKKVGIRCNGLHPDVILAWLMKQGEQKPQRMISAEAKEAMYNKPSWSIRDEHRAKDAICYLENAKEQYASTIKIEACINWLKSLKERLKGE